MKIGEDAIPARRQESMSGRTTQNAAQWLAQLERAWLEGWQVAKLGDQHGAGQTQAEAGHVRPSEANPIAASTVAQSARSATGATGATGAKGSSDRDDSARMPPAQPVESQVRIDHQQSEVRLPVVPATSGSASRLAPFAPASTLTFGRTATPIEVPAEQLQGGASSIVAPSPRPGAITSLAPYMAYPAAQRIDGDRDPEAPHAHRAQSRPNAPPSTPLQRTSMRVAVAQTSAQVTLRDASLKYADGSTAEQAIAHQLLALGLQSVRVYVNGVESRHEAHGRSIERPNEDTAPSQSNAVPIRLNPLERK